MQKSLVSLLLIESIDASEIEAKIKRYRSLFDDIFDEHSSDEASEVLLEDIKRDMKEAALGLAQQLAQVKIDSITAKLHKLMPSSEDDSFVSVVHQELMRGVEETEDSYNEMLQGILSNPHFYGVSEELNEYAKDILFGIERQNEYE